MLENSDIFKSQNSYICLRYYTYLFKSNFVFNYLVSRIWKLHFSCLRHRSPANVKGKGLCMLVMKQYTSNLPVLSVLTEKDVHTRRMTRPTF